MYSLVRQNGLEHRETKGSPSLVGKRGVKMSMLAGLAASYMHRSQGRPSLAYHKRLPLRHPLGGYQRPSVVEIQLKTDQMEIKNLHLSPVHQYVAESVWMMNTTVHCWQKKSFFPMKGGERLGVVPLTLFFPLKSARPSLHPSPAYLSRTLSTI